MANKEELQDHFKGEWGWSLIRQEGQGEAVVQESISVDRDGIVTVTLCNHSLHEAQNMELLFVQKKPAAVSGSIVRGAMNAHNTFDEPETVVEEAFTEFEVGDRGVSFVIPPCSVMMFRIG